MADLDHKPWRTRLARELGWWMIIKLALLAGLWAVFFSGPHRVRVDGPAAAGHFGVANSPGLK